MKDSEVFRRAENLWEKSPKKRPFKLVLESGISLRGHSSVVVSGRIPKQLIQLAYLTPDVRVFAEAYVFYYEQQKPTLLFGRTPIKDCDSEEGKTSMLVESKDLREFNYQEYLESLSIDMRRLRLHEILDPLRWVDQEKLEFVVE